MSTPRTVYTTMPPLRSLPGTLAQDLPTGYRYTDHVVKRHAYVENRDLIDSGTPVDVHVTDYGVVSFRFAPSADYPQAGASAGKFTPFAVDSFGLKR